MTTRLQVYKCQKCGNIVEVMHAGAGTLVCCNQPMNLFEENTVDAAQEKHVPVLERSGDGVTVTVGSVEHPMADDHYIEWIELVDGDAVHRRYLNPGQKPQARFDITASDTAFAREHCNLHGVWKA